LVAIGFAILEGFRAGVAQLVEQRIRNAKVEGSTPSAGTNSDRGRPCGALCAFDATGVDGFYGHDRTGTRRSLQPFDLVDISRGVTILATPSSRTYWSLRGTACRFTNALKIAGRETMNPIKKHSTWLAGIAVTLLPILAVAQSTAPVTDGQGPDLQIAEPETLALLGAAALVAYAVRKLRRN
jgi:hypothetical protein